MKKIYSIMLALFATLCVGTVFAQDTVTFTLNVDHPEAIMVVVDDHIDESYTTVKDTIDLVEGNNTINVPYMSYGYGNVYVTVQEGWGVASIDHNLPESDPDYEYTPTFYGEGNEWMLYVSGQCAGLTYNVVSYDLTAARTDSLLVWIDNNKGATLTYASGNTITLKDSTWNVIRFSPDSALKDIPLQVNPVALVYQVTLNGNVLPLIPGMGWFNPEHYSLAGAVDGDSVEIHVNAPADLTYPVIFNFAEPEMKAALDSVYVDKEKVEYHDTINVAWGKSILLYLNTTTYAISINENNLYRGMYSATITDTLVLNIEAIAYHDFNVTLKVHNPNCATVKCYINDINTTLADLKDGVDTVLTLNSKQSYMMISNNKSCKIDSVMINGKKELNYQQFTCKENDVIEVFADSVRRTLDLMLYVDDATKYSYPSFQNSGYDNMLPGDGKLHTGYSLIKFDETDNNFYVYMSPKPVYYQNDSLIDLGYMSSCYPTFADGDVFKIFADTAEVYTVEFVLHGEATTSNVTKDRIVAVEGTNFTVLQGTEVSFETTDTTILVNGEAVKAVEGVVTLTITANTTIEVGLKPSIANTAENPYTIAKAIELTKAGVALEDTVFVIGVVKNIGTKADKIEQYGNVDVYLTDGELEYQFRYMLNVGGAKFANIDEVNATFTSGDTLIAKGTLTYYATKDMYQLNQYCQLVEVRKSTAEPEPEPEPELVSCAVANAAEDGAIVALNEVVVAFVNGKNNFIQDNEGWTLLYVEDAGLKVGDRVTGIKGEIDIFYNTPEVIPSNLGEWTITAGEAPAPAVQEAALTTTDINHFIKLEGVALNGAFTQENNTVEGTWKGEKVAIHDKFKTNASFAEGLYDVVGVVSIYKNNLQVNFISAEAQAEGIFNASVEAKAEKFVRDGQLIIRMNGVEYNVLGAKIQ